MVDSLAERIVWGARETGVSDIAIAGGVAANAELRARVQTLGLRAVIPPRSRCTDNGAMIAHAGRLRLLAGERHGLDSTARPAWRPGAP